VPCWIEEMGDDEAFLELVRSNRQSELSPLEHGEHALRATEKGKHGKSVRAYAEAVGRPERTVSLEVAAARVVSSSPISASCLDKTRHLAELHAAAEWLWPALVRRMLEAAWTVETTRSQAGRLKDAPEPPIWADRDALAGDIVEGKTRSNERSKASAAS
jgi:hypothetical protein